MTVSFRFFIDDVCGAMQGSTSPGHHIAVHLESGIFQAKAHHRASPLIFQAVQKAGNKPDGLAHIEQSTIVVGVADYDNVTVYISEYLSNMRRTIRIQIIRRVVSIILTGLILAIILNIILQKMVALPLQSYLE